MATLQNALQSVACTKHVAGAQAQPAHPPPSNPPRARWCSTHPHRDAEIFSYVVDGELSHADSMGNKEALPRGCVQYLSAGTGITHSVSELAAPCRAAPCPALRCAALHCAHALQAGRGTRRRRRQGPSLNEAAVRWGGGAGSALHVTARHVTGA